MDGIMARKLGDTEKFEDGLGILMGAFDWQEAMKYARFEFKDIESVVSAVEGEPDETDWKLIVKLTTGKFGWLTAWCDYSGWGCREGGESGICNSLEEATAKMKEAVG